MPRVNFNRMPNFSRVVERAIGEGLFRAALAHAGFVRTGFTRAGRYGSAPVGAPPNVRRAFLRNAVTAVRVSNKRSASGVQAYIPYANIHEHGGTITAKKGKFLVIPVNPQAMRLSERTVGGLRTIPGVRLFRTRNGKLFAIASPIGVTRYRKVRGVRKRVIKRDEPLWALRRSVRIPARPYLAPALVRHKAAIVSASIEGARSVVRRELGVWR